MCPVPSQRTYGGSTISRGEDFSGRGGGTKYNRFVCVPRHHDLAAGGRSTTQAMCLLVVMNETAHPRIPRAAVQQKAQRYSDHIQNTKKDNFPNTCRTWRNQYKGPLRTRFSRERASLRVFSTGRTATNQLTWCWYPPAPLPSPAFRGAASSSPPWRARRTHRSRRSQRPPWDFARVFCLFF